MGAAGQGLVAGILDALENVGCQYLSPGVAEREELYSNDLSQKFE
jgi:hypothetical protein